MDQISPVCTELVASMLDAEDVRSQVGNGVLIVTRRKSAQCNGCYPGIDRGIRGTFLSRPVCRLCPVNICV